jgi:hypothetical protein
LAATLEHDDESRDSGVLETLGTLRSEAVKRQESIVDKKTIYFYNEEVKSIAASGIVALLRLKVNSFDSEVWGLIWSSFVRRDKSSFCGEAR